MASGAVETEAAHLVEGLGPGLAGRGPSHPQNPHGLDVSVPGLGLPVGVTGLGGSGCGDGVLGVALASPAAPLTVGPVDLDHPHAFAVQVAGETGPVGAGALDPGQLHLTEATEPPQQCSIALGCGGERLDAYQAAPLVERGGDVDVEVGVDPRGDPQWHGGHRHPFIGTGAGVAPHPAGRRTGQRRASATGS